MLPFTFLAVTWVWTLISPEPQDCTGSPRTLSCSTPQPGLPIVAAMLPSFLFFTPVLFPRPAAVLLSSVLVGQQLTKAPRVTSSKESPNPSFIAKFPDSGLQGPDNFGLFIQGWYFGSQACHWVPIQCFRGAGSGGLGGGRGWYRKVIGELRICRSGISISGQF